MQKRDDGPYIDPDTHEDSLLKTILYIEDRLQKIPHVRTIDPFAEFSKLSERAQAFGLRGYHLSQITAKVFKYIGENKENYYRDNAISELLSIKEELERDCTYISFPQDEDRSIHFYILNAYFPYRQRNEHHGAIARSYVQAAFLIRKTYGEFHLEDPPGLERIDCGHIILSQNYENAPICGFAKTPCPVFIGKDPCIKTQFEDFSKKFDDAKTLEEKIHAFDV